MVTLLPMLLVWLAVVGVVVVVLDRCFSRILVIVRRKRILIDLQACIERGLCSNCDFFPINEVLHIIF